MTDDTDDVSEFREFLKNDAHFGEALHEQIHEEVNHAAELFEEERGGEVDGEEISDIASDLLNASIDGL